MTGTPCGICPRKCRAERLSDSGVGVCKMGTLPKIARAALHMWEEPCISGVRGSGAIFFSGCALRCVFCQNRAISAGGFGKTVTAGRLREIFFELYRAGAHNINLVNPTHFADAILMAMEGGMPLPVVYNTGGYDSVSTLRRFDSKVQIYLPDMKYALTEPARRYSAAADYPETAKAAIMEMFRQTGSFKLGSDGLMERGVIIRHLVLPGNLDNTFRVIDWVADSFSPGDVMFSLMSQYTPCGDLSGCPEIGSRLGEREYSLAVAYMEASGICDGFYQELSSAQEEYIPDFDLTGV